jgi:hypothetical protein
VVGRDRRRLPIPVCGDEIGRKHAPILDREGQNEMKIGGWKEMRLEMKLRGPTNLKYGDGPPYPIEFQLRCYYRNF